MAKKTILELQAELERIKGELEAALKEWQQGLKTGEAVWTDRLLSNADGTPVPPPRLTKEQVVKVAARPTNTEQVTIPGAKPWNNGLQPTPELLEKFKKETDEVSVTCMTAEEKEVFGTLEAVGPERLPLKPGEPISLGQAMKNVYTALERLESSQTCGACSVTGEDLVRGEVGQWPISCNESDGTEHVTQEEIETGEVESEEAEAALEAAKQDAQGVLAGTTDLVGDEWVKYVTERFPHNPFLSLNVFMAATTRRIALRLMGQVRARVAAKGFVGREDTDEIQPANSLMLDADRLVENER